MSDMDYDLVLNTLFKYDEDIALVLECLANKKRLQLLTSLLRGPLAFNQLQTVTALGKTALAHHLGILVKTGLLKRISRGRYELSPDCVYLLKAVSVAYVGSKRRRELEAAKRADYIQKTHTKRREPNTKEFKVSVVNLEPMRVASVRGENPTDTQLEEALHSAYTSRYHWSKVGTAVNAVRAEYMISRVYSAMKRAEPALFHAKRCLEITKKNKIGDFDLAFAYEVTARAQAVAGNKTECKKYYELARTAIEEIKNPEDKKICEGELKKVTC